MKWKNSLLFWLCSTYAFSQINITGKVTDSNGEPIFAANVYLATRPQEGTSTDLDGMFSLTIPNNEETILEVSFIGYQTKTVKLTKEILSKENLTIILKEESQTLNEVVIMARDPISEKFSVTKIRKLDVYFNPLAQGDPLKAITILPASTTDDETANPSLRGSSPDRTRIILNGVPVYNPVRSSALNNQGFFSLFNTEIIHNQYVYASNPPLTYGNSSAGLVEIQTLRNLPQNQQQVSLSIGAVGFFLSQQLNKSENNFVQLYGNCQRYNAFIVMQRNHLPHLKVFNAKDFGLNFHYRPTEKLEFNSFNYAIDEGYDLNINSLNYSGKAKGDNQRFFSVNTLQYYTTRATLSVNTGINASHQHFDFGSIYSAKKVHHLYTSINFKSQWTNHLKVQTGLTYGYHANRFNDTIPQYPFAIEPTAPTMISNKKIENHIAEGYAYLDYEMSKKFSFSTGLRANVPVTATQKHYLNAQAGCKYKIDNMQSIFVNAGKYNSYATPNHYNKAFGLLSSYQLACDYSFQKNDFGAKAAIYYKREKGEQEFDAFSSIDKIETFGVEAYAEYRFATYVKLTVSNLFMRQKWHKAGKIFHGKYDFDYFTKITLQYSTLKWFQASLSYIGHPGGYYTPIERVVRKTAFAYPIPIFSEMINSKRFNTYHKIDFSFSRYTPLKNGTAIIPFLSITNIFDFKNESAVYYNSDYSSHYFDHYGRRIFYFGVIWER